MTTKTPAEVATDLIATPDNGITGADRWAIECGIEADRAQRVETPTEAESLAKIAAALDGGNLNYWIERFGLIVTNAIWEGSRK